MELLAKSLNGKAELFQQNVKILLKKRDLKKIYAYVALAILS